MDAEKKYNLIQSDALEFLRGLENESVDLFITDPPYESLEKHRKVGTTTRLKHSLSSSNDWFQIFPNSQFPALFEQLFRALKLNSHLYMFCDQETMFIAKPIAEAVGFVFSEPVVWDKVAIGMGYHYRARYEFILLFEKGRRPTSHPDIPNIIKEKRVMRGYPTEKPVQVSRVLIEQSSNTGNLVCDPFCGSCSVGVAAMESGRRFLGCDLKIEAIGLGLERLKTFP